MRTASLSWTLLILLVASVGCGPRAETTAGRTALVAEAVQEVEEEAARFRVVVLGDSLTAGLGLDKTEAFPSLVEAALESRGWSVSVVNAGVSGDTTAGGRARLRWLLQQRPQVVVVGLGANDGFRGLPVEQMERNLRSIVERSRQAGARVLLAGMQVPPNYGPDYAERFAAVYPALAGEFGIALMPFLLQGVGGEAALNQADGIHPNAAGQRIIADTLLPYVEELLSQVQAEEAA